jgi:hypothetical protein
LLDKRVGAVTGKNRTMIYGPKTDGTYILQYAEAECGRPDAAVRTGQTGQAKRRRRHRFRGFVGELRSAGSVVPLTYVSELHPEYVIEGFADRDVLSPVAHRRHIRPITGVCLQNDDISSLNSSARCELFHSRDLP